MKKLNLGCGKDIKKDYVNLDSVNLPGVNVIHNLDKYPWPFKDNTFDEIYASHSLEHLDSIIKPVEEIWRISKNNAKIKIKVPIFPSIWAMVTTHKQFFTYMAFDCFTEKDDVNYYSKARFKILKRKIIFNKYLPFMNLINLSEFTQKAYYLFFSFLIPANELHFDLKVIKINKNYLYN